MGFILVFVDFKINYHWFYSSLDVGYVTNFGLTLHFSYKRPIGIAVYGHPSYEISEYSLEVVYRQGKEIFVFEEEREEFEDLKDGELHFTSDKKDKTNIQTSNEVGPYLSIKSCCISMLKK